MLTHEELRKYESSLLHSPPLRPSVSPPIFNLSVAAQIAVFFPLGTYALGIAAKHLSATSIPGCLLQLSTHLLVATENTKEAVTTKTLKHG